MKTLVTGAMGFLGQRVVCALLRGGITDLRLVSRTPNPRFLDEIKREFPNAAIECCWGDLTEPGFANQVAAGVELVYHLAASMRGNGPEIIYNTAVSTDCLLTALRRQSIRRFVLVSSFSVYGPGQMHGRQPITESAPIEPHPERRDPYTYAKLKQEQLLQSSGLPYVIVRPGMVYGEGGSPLSTRVGLRFGPLFLHLGGRAWLPMTYVENCAEAIALAGLKECSAGEIINVVDDEIMRANAYRRSYSRRVKKLRVVPVPYPLLLLLGWAMVKYHRVSRGQLPAALSPYKVRALWKRCQFDNSKAKTLLGWRPKVGLEEALQRTFQYHQRYSA